MNKDLQVFHESEMNLIEFDRLVKGWELDFIQLGNGIFKSTLTQVFSSEFQLAHVHFNSSVKQEGFSTPNYWSFAFVESPALIWRNYKVQAKSIIVYAPNSEINAISTPGFDAQIISISENSLSSEVASFGLTNLMKKLKEHPVLISSPENWEELKSMIVSETEFALKNSAFNPGFLDSFTDKLIPALETAVVSKELVSSYKRKEVLAMAEKFIQKNIKESITVVDLARHCDVSERTLLYAFKERFNIGSKEFIKILKLNHIYRLLDTKSKTQSITNVSREFGFWHTGQFHHDFKAFFGLLPSEIINEK